MQNKTNPKRDGESGIEHSVSPTRSVFITFEYSYLYTYSRYSVGIITIWVGHHQLQVGRVRGMSSFKILKRLFTAFFKMVPKPKSTVYNIILYYSRRHL